MIVWTGPRESDIKYTNDFFDKSITLYGKDNGLSFCNTKNYRINHNNVTEEQTAYMVSNQRELMDSCDVKFMSYNPNLVYGSDSKVVENTICMNDEKLMKFLDSKISFREFASKFVNTLHSKLFYGRDCKFEELSTSFNAEQVIIQGDVGSGGYQTFLMDKSNSLSILKQLYPDRKYLVSPYFKNNIPINIHAIIYSEQILITPGSVRVMGQDYNRVLYRGADYITYRQIDEDIRIQFENDVLILCREIQKLGYKGVLGVDAIVVDGTAEILEVNNRFQASTILLNKALTESGLCSIQELNYESFIKEKSELIDAQILKNIEVNYSVYTYINNNNRFHYENILDTYKYSKEVVEFIDDGFVKLQECEEEAYLFRLIFNTNISSIAENKFVRVHPNLYEPEYKWYHRILNGDIKYLKIALLNQGVILEDEVKDFLNKHGGMQPGVYFAVDLILGNKYIINSPLSVKFVSLSPFRIKLIDDELFLFYYNSKLIKVNISFTDSISKTTTSKGVPVDRICLLATDRLRIQNSNFCTFKEHHIPCKFCEAQYKSYAFDIDDIKEAIDLYFKAENKKFRHVLIGGLSNDVGKEKETFVEIIKYIRQYSDMPIYLMSLPCINVGDIAEYVELGVTEIGFNVEIFDRDLAQKIMPGKGCISMERYRESLVKAVELLGDGGAVRSAFVVGLESMESLLNGVKYMCNLGVAPIFSVFRPIPGTEMQDINPPSNQWLLEVYEKAEEICISYNLHLGPSCAACQNNTLSFDELCEGIVHE